MLQYNVLIVDDDKFMINLTSRMLKKMGFETVISADDGTAGLAAVDDHSPDIILCDLNMPGMDGLEFLRHLSNRDSDASVILVSGEDKRVLQTATQLAEAHRLQVLGALKKPVHPDDLQALISTFENGHKPHQRASLEMLSRDEVEVGIRSGCVDTFFQPKVTVSERRIDGVESLMRWRDLEKGIISPGAVIPVAESNGLIDALTEKVFERSMQSAGRWLQQGLMTKISVNFSVGSLSNYDLVDAVLAGTEAAGIDPGNVVLEVTESRVMENVAAVLEVLTRLRMKGVGLSIDDFGTGASSLQQLKRIPFTELKIDRAFVSGAPRDDEARAMLQSSVDLASSLGLTTVAEGVETQEEWDLVADMGVDQVQGYFVAKPMPADQLLEWAQGEGK